MGSKLILNIFHTIPVDVDVAVAVDVDTASGQRAQFNKLALIRFRRIDRMKSHHDRRPQAGPNVMKLFLSVIYEYS